MGRLTHIDDIERQRAEEQAAEAAVRNEQVAMREEQTAEQQTRSVQAEQQALHQGQARPQDPSQDRAQQVRETVAQRLENDIDMTAEQEAAFHGLDEKRPLSVGHKALIALAIVVVVATILYIVNSYVHFI